jgi:microcystin-dependent protein
VGSDEYNNLIGYLAPTGAEIQWPVATPPAGWLIENGSSQLIASYPDLSALIRGTYGGEDALHFYLPDWRGVVPVGYKSGDASFGTLNQAGGAMSHTLTVAEMPSHSHGLNIRYNATGLGATKVTMSSNTGVDAVDVPSIQNTGGGGSHNNLQPYRVRNFIIKT